MSDGKKGRAWYCVACNADLTPKSSLAVCSGSRLGLAHLWAVVGHVEEWFDFKRPSGDASKSSRPGETP